MGQPLIDLKNITKAFDGTVVLDDLNLSVKENTFVTLLGPSGCGKTTTLRIIGGFERPDQGTVIFDGQDITSLPPNKRQLNTVFQKYALFTHMSIAENIAFGLKIKNKPRTYIQDKIKYALKLVNLDGFENRTVDSLSGGQQQRIAIARAIVNEPRVLLLDEPLGALDLKLRQDMQYELIRLKNELGITFIYVTHDQEEALTMSDTIVVMNQGYIQQMGSPESIYNEPENAFVADFIGESNIVPGIMIRDELVEIFGAKFVCVDKGFGNNKPVDVVIPPGGHRFGGSRTGLDLRRGNPFNLQRRSLRDGSHHTGWLRVARTQHGYVPGRTGSGYPRGSIRHPDHEQAGFRG